MFGHCLIRLERLEEINIILDVWFRLTKANRYEDFITSDKNSAINSFQLDLCAFQKKKNKIED